MWLCGPEVFRLLPKPLSPTKLVASENQSLSIMLKVRIIAASIAIVLTIITIYLVPKVVHFYISFMNGLNQDQQFWFGVIQALLGALVAGCAYWRWKKKKS